MKKLIYILALLLPVSVNAEEILNNQCKITAGENEYARIEDDNYSTFVNFNKDLQINIECDTNFKNIYIMYNKKNTEGSLNYNNKEFEFGKNGYLNEVLKLKSNTKKATLTYDDNFSIAEIYILGESLPKWVQDWQTLEKSDLMLFSTHADDEQLFFAGLMPTYIDKGYKIQVVYFTNHYNNTLRYHEQLEGLWTIGIKYYPVISTFPDAYSTSLDGAIANLNSSGYTVDDALAFEVNQIRKFRPYVVVGHDEKGEYSHGQHILNTDVLKKAIKEAANGDYHADNDPWQISKLYLHLYNQNQIILDYDIPLKSYGGKTAYEVAKEGYAKHYSQQYTWFTDWLNGPNNSYTSATEIKTYNPAVYGLYYSSVGEDNEKNDMFENVKFPISEIIFNDKTSSPLEKFKKNYLNLNNQEKIILYSGLAIIFISITLVMIKNKKH
ncbi:MAG: hypothetical protein E7164_02865 [Firmicutes bacterium]|nr:hypothetical protein [Bacillota bacterium]